MDGFESQSLYEAAITSDLENWPDIRECTLGLLDLP